MKVAIVHDWLPYVGGAEYVIKAMLELFPDADVYTSVYNKEKVGDFLGDVKVYTSFIDKLPLARKRHQIYLNLMPLAFEQFDLRGYDVVISSSTCCAKAVITDAQTPHICYCNTPMRYAWDLYFEYLDECKNPIKKAAVALVMHRARKWDVLTSNRVDYFIANSHNVARRIYKHYRRQSHVIYPPVDTSPGINTPYSQGDYYLVLSRLVPYKRIDVAVEAFNELGKPLVIAGDGPEMDKLRKMAKPNIRFMGRVSEEEKYELYRGCKAFLFPGEEDFGITPVEAQSFGKPVIALGRGGALETVIDGQTGVHYSEGNAKGLIEAVKRAETIDFNPDVIKQNALKFDWEMFKKQLKQFVEDKVEKGIGYPGSGTGLGRD